MIDPPPPGPSQPRGRGAGSGGNESLLDLLLMVGATNPGFVRMRRHPEVHAWASDLASFSAEEELRPLSEPLRRVAELHAEGPPTFDPFFDAFGARPVDLRTLIRASQLASERCGERPHASFMLAWTVGCIWVLRAGREGRDLYFDGAGPLPGVVDDGWRSIPAACVLTSVRLRGLFGAELLAEEALSVLQTNARRRPGLRSLLEPAISEYRRLGRIIATRQEEAVSSLADDLRDACTRERGGRAHRLVAALLWTLGLVPECTAFRAASAAPSGALMRRLVRSSIRVIPTDPLVQYVWLEMKTAPEVDLRAHEALFAVLNHRWDSWMADGHFDLFGLPCAPSQEYARTLEALLAGDLAEASAAEYVHDNDLSMGIPPGAPPAAYLHHRFAMMRHLVGERFDFFDPSVAPATRVEWLRQEMIIAARVRRRATTYPELPDAGTRTSIASFEFIERCLADDSPLDGSEHDRCALASEAVECFRTGALAFWLDVNPPLRPESADGLLQRLWSEESDALELLRGGYFLALRPTLPEHFKWSDIDMSDFLALQEDADHRAAFYSPEGGRREMDEAERALAQIANRLPSEVADYASMRRRPTADVRSLTSVLARHRGR